jgi:hypothetical protein
MGLMGKWYQNNRRLFREERKALSAICPLLRFAVVSPGFKVNDAMIVDSECVVAHGTYAIRVPETEREIEYGIVILFPENYPKRPPILFCNDSKLPIGVIDRHIMKNGGACLGVRAEINNRWKLNPAIANFIENMASPFLAWQTYFDVFHKPPSWGERAHFINGIREFYAEILGMPAATEADIIGFMKLLARKNSPKGHELCPCNSGEKLRNCHRSLIDKVRQQIDWWDVQQDLQELQ